MLATLPLIALEYQEGFDGDDVYIAVGEGTSKVGETRPVQKEASAKQAARIIAEARFADACIAPKSAGGHCREMTADLKEVMSLGRGAKVVGSECIEEAGSPGMLHCRVALKFTRKNLKTICAKLQEEGGQFCP
ncbi:hypothetical protein [Turneriella parva]|uniref:hypothetical protein n=1 Tax=Turneriella parva TaxID=29510 RepID=UPI0005A5378B|nr:hypothetical protein [Turneriella parva]